MTTTKNQPCPATLNIAGKHYPCQQMEQMAPGSVGHDGWAHSNRDADAIWCDVTDDIETVLVVFDRCDRNSAMGAADSDRDPIPGMPGWKASE